MRLLLKFLHSVGAAGMTGAAAALAIVVLAAPASGDAPGYIPFVVAMANITAWILGPSIVLTVATGLLAMIATPAYQDVGWVWVKAASGLLVLQAGLHVIGPIQEEAKRSAAALAAEDPASAAHLFAAEANTLWVLLAVSVANIALGVWRPRFPQYPV